MSFAHRHEALQKATNLVSREVESFDGLADDILTRVAIETIKKYQQKLSVGIQDSATDLLDTFKLNVTSAIFDTANSWKLITRDPFIFPRDCRFCYQKGDSTIVVIEQGPQIRSLSFREGMLDREFSGGSGADRITLAFPYVVFLIHYRNGDYEGLYSGWRNRPLGSLDDMIYRPLLPNVHDHLAICTSGEAMLRKTIVEQSDIAITGFWNSRFNNDLSDRWWSKGSVSSQLATAHTWADASEENPLFMLDIEYSPAKTIQQMIDLVSMHETAPDEGPLRHRLSEEIDKCIEFLFHKILHYFKKTKFDRHHPKDVEEHLKGAIKQSSEEFVEVVGVLSQEIENLSKDVGLHRNKPADGRGIMWREYCP